MLNEGSPTGVSDKEKKWKAPEEPKPEEQKSKEAIREQIRKEQIEEARQRAEGIQERAKGASPKILERVKMWTEKLSSESADLSLFALDAIQNDFEEMLRDPESEIWDQYAGFRPEEIRDLSKILYGEEMEPERSAVRKESIDIFRRGPKKNGIKGEKPADEISKAKEKALRPAENDFQREVEQYQKLGQKEGYLAYVYEIDRIRSRVAQERLGPVKIRHEGWTTDDYKKLLAMLNETEVAQRPSEEAFRAMTDNLLAKKSRKYFRSNYYLDIDRLRISARTGESFLTTMSNWTKEDFQELLKRVGEKEEPGVFERIRRRVGGM